MFLFLEAEDYSYPDKPIRTPPGAIEADKEQEDFQYFEAEQQHMTQLRDDQLHRQFMASPQPELTATDANSYQVRTIKSFVIEF